MRAGFRGGAGRPQAVYESQRTGSVFGAQALFPGVPVAMLSYDDLKVTRYHGPDDVVAFLKQVRVVSLPWVEYTIGE